MAVRVYRYGLLAPTVGAPLVEAQINRAHRYHNTLVEIERSRREAVRAVLSAHGTVEPLEARVTALKAMLAATAKPARAKSAPPEAREAFAATREQLRAARVDLKAARATLRAAAQVSAAIAAINQEHHARTIQARAACGCYWGTYLQVEQAVDAARRSRMEPHFRRWTGGGAVAVQLHGGLSVDGVLAGSDTRLRIHLALQVVPGRGGRPMPRVALRVGSDGRAPVWAEWPLVYDRPLPAGGAVKWAKALRRRVAGHDQWSLHLTGEHEREPAIAPPDGGTVAVDLGWRREAGTLRAGGWADDAGRGGDIMLAPEVRGALRKSEDLRSIRDRHQNRLRTILARCSDIVPEEQREQMLFLSQWRSAGRFAALALWWREHRWAGDAALYTLVAEWRKRDKHLWSWEANGRQKALLRRREQYRVLAAELSRRYATLVVERLDLAALAAIPAPDSTRESNPRARAQRVDTAPSELRSAMEQAFRSRGRDIYTVPPSGPAAALLAAYVERSGTEEKTEVARVSRFSRLAANRHRKRSDATGAETPPETGQ